MSVCACLLCVCGCVCLYVCGGPYVLWLETGSIFDVCLRSTRRTRPCTSQIRAPTTPLYLSYRYKPPRSTANIADLAVITRASSPQNPEPKPYDIGTAVSSSRNAILVATQSIKPGPDSSSVDLAVAARSWPPGPDYCKQDIVISHPDRLRIWGIKISISELQTAFRYLHF